MDSNVAPITQDTARTEQMPEFIVLKFADSKIPVFKESRNKEYIKYGENNLYPDYLTYLFNKSAKHNAIVSGKAFYVFGEGYENGDLPVNRLGETLNDISKRAILDIEIYGGFRLEVIWNAARKVSEIYHVDYTTLRVGKNGGYWFKENWEPLNRDEEVFIPAFNPNNPVGSQIFAYNEYRPKTRFYPLPSYIGCNNFIETDIEISKYYLSCIRNGMMPSKMIQFFKGEPTEDKKREIEARMSRKFAGAENAGKFLLVFNDANASKSVEVNDLSASDLDKHMIELNKTCQQEIFSGHLVTSPMLFGIKTEGQLGGNTELKASYELFVNTYAKPKANSFDDELNYIMAYSMWPGNYELRQTDPVGIIIPDALLQKALTPEEVRERLNLPAIEKPADGASQKTLTILSSISPLVANKILENLTPNEMRALGGLPPRPGGDAIVSADGQPIAATPAKTTASPDLNTNEGTVNDAVRNLTGKQHQQLLRIIRQYGKGQITEEIARTLLRTSLGLSDSDIDSLLGITDDTTLQTPTPVATAAMAAELTEEDVIGMFDECGEVRDDFEVLKSKKVCFSTDKEAQEDEAIYIQDAFKTVSLTRTEEEILKLIKADPKITPDVIATTINQTTKYVTSKLANLVKRGILETATETIGLDEIVSHIIPNEISLTPPPVDDKQPPVQVMVKYSYEVKPGIGPAIIATTRPFCRKMIELNRLYSRAEIEKISLRLGYSVWDRKGGWWGKKEECRHRWVSNVVVKKK